MEGNKQIPEFGPRSLVDRSATYVLESMLRGSDVRARRLAIARIDPLVRREVDQRIESLLGNAEFDAPDGSEAHRICLALLELAGIEPASPADESAVTERVARLPTPKRPPPWTRSLSVAAALVVATACVAVYLAVRPKPYAALTMERDETRTAYRSGGRPVHDEAIDSVLGVQLQALTLAAGRAAEHSTSPDTEFRSVQDALHEAAFVRALSAYPSGALDRVVSAYAAFARGTGDANAVFVAVRKFDESCVARGLGYRVDAFPVAGGSIALATSSVEKVGLARIGRATRRVLIVSRLDRLNVLVPALGYLSDGVAVIPVEAIDRFAIEVVLPLLETPPRPTLIDPRVSLGRHPWLEATHASAGVGVKQALRRSGCGSEIDELVRLLAERRALFERWTTHLGQFGITVVQPDTYRIDVDALRESAGSRLPRFEDLERVQDALAAPAASTAFGCVRSALAVDLAVQAADFAASSAAPVDELRAPSLVALIDPAQTMAPAAFRDDPSVVRIRGALTRIEQSPSQGFTLMFMLRCYTHGGSCSRASEVATVFAFTELARELRLTSFVEPVRAGASAVGAIYRELVTRPEAEVRAAAGAVFRRIFGRAPPTLEIP